MANGQIDLDLLRQRITRSGGQRGRGGGRARGLGAFNQFTTLLSSIQGDQTISDITKGELTSSLGELAEFEGAADTRAFQSNILGNLGSINKRLAAAREGGGIFAGRQQQKQRRSILADRPGRAQTILTR